MYYICPNCKRIATNYKAECDCGTKMLEKNLEETWLFIKDWPERNEYKQKIESLMREAGKSL